MVELICLVIAFASEMHDVHKKKKESRNYIAKLLPKLLGENWSQTLDVQWFATHTLCQRCKKFFDTTNPQDECELNLVFGYHVYTPLLDAAIRNELKRVYGKQAKVPPLFLPGGVRSGVVCPPPVLDKDWVLLDADDNSAAVLEDVTPGECDVKCATQSASAAASSSSSKSVVTAAAAHVDPHPPAQVETEAERKVARAFNSSELRELVVTPTGLVPVSDEEALQSYSRLVAALPPSERDLLPEFPHPPDVDPQPDADDQDGALFPQLPHPPLIEPSASDAPPSYAAAAVAAPSM